MNVSDEYTWKKAPCRDNNPMLPDNIRGLIVGKSNCGKTTLLLNLLLQPGWMDYNHLYVFGRSLHQKEYRVLKKGYEDGLSKQQVANIFLNQDALAKIQLSPIECIEEYSGFRDGSIKADFFSDCSLIPDPSELNVEEKNLLILDDCFLGPQTKAEAYYTRGRHNSCDSLYISQNYFRLPRRTIRENANFIILFPQDAKNLNHIYTDHCGDEMPFVEFKSFCRKVWNAAPFNFVTINLTSDKLHGKYRKNLDWFYYPIDSERPTLER